MRGQGTRALPLWGDGLEGPAVAVSKATSLAEARFCESVESDHSDQAQSARIAELLGITQEPFRIDSQCNYAAIARGDASIYLRPGDRGRQAGARRRLSAGATKPRHHAATARAASLSRRPRVVE